MSTLFTAIILVGGASLLCFLFISIEERRSRKERNQFLKKFSELGSRYELSFASQEVLNNSIIGIDGMNRKLLVLQNHGNDLYSHSLIHLDEVSSCSLENGEIILDTGGAYELYPKKRVTRIDLCFHFSAPKDPVCICFYDAGINDEREEDVLGQKAKDWEAILSKMLMHSKVKIIA